MYNMCKKKILLQAKPNGQTHSQTTGQIICTWYSVCWWQDCLKARVIPGPNFRELLSTKICLAWNFFLHKNRITKQISNCCKLLITGVQLLNANPENHVKTWLVILFFGPWTFSSYRKKKMISGLHMQCEQWTSVSAQLLYYCTI